MAVGRDSRGFFMLKGIVGDSAKDGFFVMYTLFGRKRGGFLTNFLIFTEGGGFVIPFSLQKQNFIVWSK